MSEKFTPGQFTPGQTVWRKSDGQQLTIYGPTIDRQFCWDDNDYCVDVPIHDLTATDPKQPAEAVPQDCPLCNRKPVMHSSGTPEKSYVYCDGGVERDRLSCICGPERLTRLEAIQAWNRLSWNRLYLRNE